MIRNIRRQDKHKVQDLRKVRQQFISYGCTEDEIFFACLKKVPNATAREHAWSKYYVTLGDKPPNGDIMKLFTQEKRLYNVSRENPDEEAIGVPHQIQDVHGNKRRITFLELATGEAARDAAMWCDIPVQGYQKKKKRLLEMSQDRRLKARHDAKLRQLEQRGRRGGARK
jgi:hypothetical protein